MTPVLRLARSQLPNSGLHPTTDRSPPPSVHQVMEALSRGTAAIKGAFGDVTVDKVDQIVADCQEVGVVSVTSLWCQGAFGDVTADKVGQIVADCQEVGVVSVTSLWCQGAFDDVTVDKVDQIVADCQEVGVTSLWCQRISSDSGETDRLMADEVASLVLILWVVLDSGQVVACCTMLHSYACPDEFFTSPTLSRSADVGRPGGR